MRLMPHFLLSRLYARLRCGGVRLLRFSLLDVCGRRRRRQRGPFVFSVYVIPIGHDDLLFFHRNMLAHFVFRAASAEQGNEYAAYQLGKLYLAAEGIPKDVQTAVKWLEMASEKGNPYAQYALGKLYLTGGDVPRDKEKAVFYLQASAAQGNLYAQFFLEHLDSFQDPSIFLMATRLLHILEKLFQEDYRKGVGGSPYYIDRKRRRRLAEKKQAQGHKRDDYEPGQQFSG